MGMIQIRNVPDPLHRELKARAARAGRERGPVYLEETPAEAVREERESRFLPRIWALRANATAYDAAYLTLAEALDAELVTADRKLAMIPGHGARVVVVGA